MASTPTAVHLTPPTSITPIASPAIAGEGQWHPAGRRVDGLPAVYEAYLRPDAVHTSVVVGVAWMDTKLLSATLYSGSTIPGGGPWRDTAPVSTQASGTLVAAFNAGFLMSNAEGGYYTQGKTVLPLRTGAASFVVYNDGTATVGQWGRDVTMTPEVRSVRQNLDLVVDGGHPVPGLNANDTTQWGFTLRNQVYVWRSGVGVTATGALVYVGGPDMNITDLADVLGACRGGPGHGARHQYRLGESGHLCAILTHGPRCARQRFHPPLEHGRRARAVLRVLVVARLLYDVSPYLLSPQGRMQPRTLPTAPSKVTGVIQEVAARARETVMLRSCSGGHHVAQGGESW